MPFAAALSQHPITAHAVGEVAGQLLEHLGEDPDLALLFMTSGHAGALEDAAAAVRAVLRPATLVGCAAASVIGGAREVEDEPGVSLWAGRFGAVAPVQLTAFRADGEIVIEGWPDPLPFEPQALVLIADPFSFPAEECFAHVADRWPGLPVIGGLASAARGPGGNRLAVDGDVVTHGAVGAFLGPGLELTTVVSQGCRPIGRPYVVTRAEPGTIYELAGIAALSRLEQMAEANMTEDEVELFNRAPHVGQVIDERKDEFGRGDFLVRNVTGADRATGAVRIGADIETGTTVQFHVRDAATADEDLRSMMAGHSADAALLFTCNGRGTYLFGSRDHDAGVVSDAVATPAVAGFFAAGEFGPVGGRNFLHGFTASVALLRERPGAE